MPFSDQDFVQNFERQQWGRSVYLPNGEQGP